MKFLLPLVAFACVALAQDYLNYYPFKGGYADPAYPMPIVANVSTNPPAISLHWAINTFWLTHQFTIQRRKFDLTTYKYSEEQFLKNETGGNLVLTSTWGGMFYHTDYTVEVGVCYEYRVVPPQNPSYPDRGTFIFTGIDVDYPENRGIMLLVIEDVLKDKITSSLQTLKDDLEGDGWKVLTEYVNRNDSVPSVKEKIKSYYDAGLRTNQNLTSVYLFGRIPVPYSGDYSPDGHPDYHNGAWPSDRYYGVFDVQFTDSWVNDTSGYYPRYRNVPGDGKYDQSSYTSQDLWITRVDFADMTTLVSEDATESELLSKYIDKTHRYKINHPSMRFQNYGMAADTFVGGYAYLSYAAWPSAVGWDNMVEGNFMQLGRTPILDNKNVTVESTLFAFGSGPGDWTSAANIGQSSDYVTYNPKAAFTFTFGSLFGDWDQKDNFMRAALLSNYSLCNAWVGRPHWVMHHLSLGVPLGLSPMFQQSSYYGRWYPYSYCVYCTHVTLLGDPSLRLFSVSPPENVQAVTSGSVIDISWNIPEDPLPIAGFRVSVLGSDGKWTRSSGLLSNTTSTYRFTPPNGFTATYKFSVRTVRVEERSSGRWFNPSIGMMASADIVGTPPPVTSTSGKPSATGSNPSSTSGSTTGSSTKNVTAIVVTFSGLTVQTFNRSLFIKNLGEALGLTLQKSTDLITIIDVSAANSSQSNVTSVLVVFYFKDGTGSTESSQTLTEKAMSALRSNSVQGFNATSVNGKNIEINSPSETGLTTSDDTVNAGEVLKFGFAALLLGFLMN